MAEKTEAGGGMAGPGDRRPVRRLRRADEARSSPKASAARSSLVGAAGGQAGQRDPAGDPSARRGGGSYASASTAAPTPRTADMSRIITVHPRTYNEARTIGEHFRDGVPVIMNLSEMEDVDAKRLVDFAAGLIFGLRGRSNVSPARCSCCRPPMST